MNQDEIMAWYQAVNAAAYDIDDGSLEEWSMALLEQMEHAYKEERITTQ